MGGSFRGLEKRLSELYSQSPEAAFRDPSALHKAAKEEGIEGATLRVCRDFLQSLPSYALYRRKGVVKSRNVVRADFEGQIVEADLCDMNSLVKGGDPSSVRYCFLACCVYSKLCFLHPIPSKTPESILAALKAMISFFPFKILLLFWDKEPGWTGKVVQSWLRSLSIFNYHSTDFVKASQVERMIRTFRSFVMKRMEYTGDRHWENHVLPFQEAYNNRAHSTTRRVPWTLATNPLVLPAERPKRKRKPKKKLPPIGSYVRLSRLSAHPFEKEAAGGWTREIFRIASHSSTKPAGTIPMATVESLTGEMIKGRFYAEELASVPGFDPKHPQIAEVLQRRKRQGKWQVLATFIGFPSNTPPKWIPQPRGLSLA